jgi:hypothetical protein
LLDTLVLTDEYETYEDILMAVFYFRGVSIEDYPTLLEILSVHALYILEEEWKYA